jgi:hypothetical protein
MTRILRGWRAAGGTVLILAGLAGSACSGTVLAVSEPSPVQVEQARKVRGETATCRWNIIVSPPEMEGVPGLWFHADPDGSVPMPEEGCPAYYPRWTVSPAVRFLVYHRPQDVANGNPDPERYGNWAVIPNPTSGASYAIRVENEGYVSEILVTAP